MINPEFIFEEQDKPLSKEVWNIIPTQHIQEEKHKIVAHRLNSYGSLFYFIKVTLRKHRLTDHLHQSICRTFEQQHLQEVLEIPRDHFKSTIGSEGAPMWWALPFNDEDEDFMRKLGYSDEWIRWMKRAHNRDTRTLLVSENITNAAKLGKRIEFHYLNNNFFRGLFPEIIPDTSCSWSQYSMTHLRSKTQGAAHGEGTFDFLGVGGALQSRHYIRVGQDDLVGREALKSEKVMNDTIEYHKLLVGAFDSDYESGPDAINDEYIIGNRWAYNDLNNYIKENESFHFTSHSALGGCCAEHPAGQIIFPEEFGQAKLDSWQRRLGTYLFSCQFLNSPTLPGQTRFLESNLRYYWQEAVSKDDLRMKICHEVQNSEVIKDIMPATLSISLVTDPAHSEGTGRCRHAIVVTGYQVNPRRVYLFECWAESCTYDKYIAKIFEFVKKYKLRKIFLETVAAQKYLKYHLEYRNKMEIALGQMKDRLIVEPLKTEQGERAKDLRIESFDEYYSNGQVFIKRVGHENFKLEYSQYPHGKTKDILDVMGYCPQTWGYKPNDSDLREFKVRSSRGNPFASSRGNTNSNTITGY